MGGKAGTVKTAKKHKHRWVEDLEKDLIENCSCGKSRKSQNSSVIVYGLGKPMFDEEGSECPSCNEESNGEPCGAHRFIDQMRLGHSYGNKLTELYRASSERYREIIGSASKKMEVIVMKLDDLDDQIKGLNALLKADKDNKEAKKLKKELTADRKIIRADRKELVEKLKQNKIIQARLKKNNIKLNSEIIKARGEFSKLGLMWGTYNLHEASAKQAQYAPGRRGDPEFKRWEGHGRIGVQLQGGLPESKVWGDSRSFQIDKVDHETWSKLREDGSPDRAFRRKQCRTKVRVRIGSAKAKPIWVEFPMTMHRPIPEGADIRDVTILQKKSGTIYRYSLHVQINENKTNQPERSGVVGVNLGWRKHQDNTLRVAYWYGDDGRYGEYLLDSEYLEKVKVMDGKQSKRSMALDVIKETFAVWLDGQDNLPEWIQEWRGIKFIRDWRSSSRLASLVLRWRKNRFDGDALIFENLEEWRRADKHTCNQEGGIRNKNQLRRQDEYRNFAAFLARTYGKVVVDDTNYANLARKPGPEDDDNKVARKQANLASPGKLRVNIKNACHKHGAIYVAASSKHITATCHKCGTINDWDKSLSLTHWCSGCNAFWDQDMNAAINLCRSGGGKPPNFEHPGDARIELNDEVNKYDWLIQESAGMAGSKKQPIENLAVTL